MATQPVPARGSGVDVTGRALSLRPVDLDRFFHPETVAVIGASATTGTPNAAMWRKLHAWGVRTGAEVIPIHPTRPAIDGVPCVASIGEIGRPVDVAAILVGEAVAIFHEVAEAGARFAIIFSAGFAETGPSGRARQAELDQLLATHPDTRLLGPNTNLNAFEPFRDDLDGAAVALITQSGHQGRPVFQAQQFGVRVSHWAPTGNEADLELADFAAYFAGLPTTGAIAAYVEGFADGRSLQLAADRAAQHRCPMVMVKVGRTAAGRAMATSHTGHLAGADRVVDAVFGQYGITRVDGLDELADTAAMFARTVPPRSLDRPLNVCIYSISGGTGAHLADLASTAGLPLPELSATTQRRLRSWIPDYLSVANPVDSGGPPSMDERGRLILEALVADPDVDLLLCPITGAVDAISRPLATDLAAVAETTDKPIYVVWGSPDLTDPVYTDILVPSSKLVLFRTFGNCVRAARAYADYWSFQSRYTSPFATVATRPSRVAQQVTPILASASGGSLGELSTKELLRTYGVATTDDHLCGSGAEAVRAAEELGFPVVMKVAGHGLPHKSEHGGVRLDVGSPTEVRRVHRQLLAAARSAGLEIDGVLVAEQVREGVECMAGISTDAVFGPVIVFGLGGVHVEVLDDVAIRVPPFDRHEAERMVRSIKGFGLLDGARGAPKADVKALVGTLMKLQRLALDQASTLAELDINPLLVRPRGQGTVALDAFAVLH